MVSDLEKYLFDVRGYLVVKGALGQDELKHINALVDREERGRPEHKTPHWRHFETFLEDDEVLRAQIDNPRILPYLETFMGKGGDLPDPRQAQARLDHSYFIFSDTGHPGGALHLGNIPYEPSCSYNVRNGSIFSALTVVSYVLCDVRPGEGFACIPGSHKANFACPPELRKLERPELLTALPAEPGDAIIFTEAMTHGTHPWTAPHQRRALFFKYSPGYMAWARPRWSPQLLDKCTDRQRAMLEPAYVVDHPDFFATLDGLPQA